MLRVNSNFDIVVPPFECAWLSDECLQLKDEAGCIAFEVKGSGLCSPLLRDTPQIILSDCRLRCAWISDAIITFYTKIYAAKDRAGETDASIICKAFPGSRRWQHQSSLKLEVLSDNNYTVIIGSHRNSSLKVEKNGQLCKIVSRVPHVTLVNMYHACDTLLQRQMPSDVTTDVLYRCKGLPSFSCLQQPFSGTGYGTKRAPSALVLEVREAHLSSIGQIRSQPRASATSDWRHGINLWRTETSRCMISHRAGLQTM